MLEYLPVFPRSVPDDDPPPPLVFISYSHDSEEHKQWVMDMASRLVRDHLGHWTGDDLAKFKGPAFADRKVTREDGHVKLASGQVCKQATVPSIK